MLFSPRRGIMAEAEYPGLAQLVARVVWECRGGIRNRARRNAAKPCDTCTCGIFSDCRKLHKSGFDHINDHRQKIFIFTLRRGIMAEIEYPGVAKLVSRLIWVQETGRSSRPTRTKIPLKSLISEGFSYSLSIAAQNLRCVVMVMKSRTSVFPQLSFHDFETLPFRLIGCKSLYNIVHCF